MTEPAVQPARIESLRAQNYRVLRDFKLSKLSPLTVLLRPNGSGKSTLFDVFAFLSECFTVGLRRAWDQRNRFRELRSRGSGGPIVIELKYRERRKTPLITYHLAIGETRAGPVVAEEWLRWTRGLQGGRPFKFLDFHYGEGSVISGDLPEIHDQRVPETLESPELLAVNTLGQFARHPRVSALRRFISGWYLSYLAADSTRGAPEAGPQERLLGVLLPRIVLACGQTLVGCNFPPVVRERCWSTPGDPNSVAPFLRLRRKGVEALEAWLQKGGAAIDIATHIDPARTPRRASASSVTACTGWWRHDPPG